MEEVKGRATYGLEAGPGDTLFASAQEIQNYLLCHPVVARLLWGRGFRSVQLLDRFLKPELSQLPDPFSIKDMRVAAERVAAAIEAGEKIAVYGDYDVDGTCGSSILIDLFRSLGVEAMKYQPNRFTEGYGVHVAAVEKLIAEGARVILTVDCGITAVAPAKAARALGVDLIVIDHHKVGAELPAATAIVNPQQADDTSGLLNVCGAGLAFFFAVALRSVLRARGFFAASARPEPNLVKLLDLVAIATIADVVDVRGVNRILVAHGLKVMARSPRVGVRALLEAARIEKPTAMHCGFVLGPRINAAGRLKSAHAAFELLTSENAEEARQMALELEKVNTERRATQDEVHAQARAQALLQLEDRGLAELAKAHPNAAFGPWPRALVLAPPAGAANWHEGVVGIVASKIVEEFGRPAFVLAEKEGTPDALKGSARSIPKVDILAAISAPAVAATLTNFGGHAHAGGVALKRARLDDFIAELNLQLALTTTEEHYVRERRFDAEVRIEEIDAKLVEELEALGPFGQKFPEPTLKLVGVTCAETRVMKEKHLKFRLTGGGRTEAVWFNARRDEKLEAGAPCALWVQPGWNEWQGTRRLQLMVRHAELEGEA